MYATIKPLSTDQACKSWVDDLRKNRGKTFEEATRRHQMHLVSASNPGSLFHDSLERTHFHLLYDHTGGENSSPTFSLEFADNTVSDFARHCVLHYT